MNLSRRSILAGVTLAPLAGSAVAAPLVTKAGAYTVKPVNDGFAAVVQTRDFGVLANDAAVAAELQRKLDRHLILHIQPEVEFTREAVGQFAYKIGFPKGGSGRVQRPQPVPPPGTAATANADGYGGQPASQGGPVAPRPAGKYGEYSFIADFGGPAEPTPTVTRKPRYIETLHTDGGAYSFNTTIDVPPASPHTFVDMGAAYRSLPRELKKLAETHHALHAGMATTQTPYDELPAFDPKQALRRPMVIAHSRTQQPLLYVPKNPHSLIEGMPEDEGRAVIAELWSHINTQRNRYMAFSGNNHTMVWDAFGTSHTNPSYRREKARITWFFVVPSNLPITQAKIA